MPTLGHAGEIVGSQQGAKYGQKTTFQHSVGQIKRPLIWCFWKFLENTLHLQYFLFLLEAVWETHSMIHILWYYKSLRSFWELVFALILEIFAHPLSPSIEFYKRIIYQIWLADKLKSLEDFLTPPWCYRWSQHMEKKGNPKTWFLCNFLINVGMHGLFTLNLNLIYI